MDTKCDNIKEIRCFVRNSVVKLSILVIMLMVVVRRDMYCSIVFVMASIMGYFRFYCMSDMFSIICNKGSKVSYWSILNYFLTFFITIVFFKKYCLGHGNVCMLCGILGITIVSFGIIFGCISGELRKMSITKRR